MNLLVDEERREGGNITQLRQQKDTEEVEKMCEKHSTSVEECE